MFNYKQITFQKLKASIILYQDSGLLAMLKEDLRTSIVNNIDGKWKIKEHIFG